MENLSRTQSYARVLLLPCMRGWWIILSDWSSCQLVTDHSIVVDWRTLFWWSDVM